MKIMRLIDVILIYLRVSVSLLCGYTADVERVYAGNSLNEALGTCIPNIS